MVAEVEEQLALKVVNQICNSPWQINLKIIRKMLKENGF